MASFWEQSGRVINYSNFADVHRYWTPTQIAKNPRALELYRETMAYLQVAYEQLIEMKIPAEEARGIIPLHILTRGTFAINLRALKGLIRNRVCFVCQGSYWGPVIKGMLEELQKHLPPKTLRSLVNLPCAGHATCPIEGSVLQRISGEDPNPVCPIYLTKFEKNPKEVEAKENRRFPDYQKIKEEYLELIHSMKILEGGDSSVGKKGC
jgi:hypothetical protein